VVGRSGLSFGGAKFLVCSFVAGRNGQVTGVEDLPDRLLPPWNPGTVEVGGLRPILPARRWAAAACLRWTPRTPNPAALRVSISRSAPTPDSDLNYHAHAPAPNLAGYVAHKMAHMDSAQADSLTPDMIGVRSTHGRCSVVNLPIANVSPEERHFDSGRLTLQNLT